MFVSLDISSRRDRRDVGKPNPITSENQNLSTKVSGKETLTPYSKTTSRPSTPYSTQFNSYYTPYNSYSTPYNSYSTPYNSYYRYSDPGYEYQPGYSQFSYQDQELLPPKEDVEEQTLLLERFTTIVTRVPEDQLKLAGHQFKDFVANCTWRGLECKNRYV